MLLHTLRRTNTYNLQDKMSIFNTDVEIATKQAIVDQLNKINRSQLALAQRDTDINAWVIKGETLQISLFHANKENNVNTSAIDICQTSDGRFVPILTFTALHSQAYKIPSQVLLIGDDIQKQYNECGIREFEWCGAMEQMNLISPNNSWDNLYKLIGNFTDIGVNKLTTMVQNILVVPTIPGYIKTWIIQDLIMPEYVTYLDGDYKHQTIKQLAAQYAQLIHKKNPFLQELHMWIFEKLYSTRF